MKKMLLIFLIIFLSGCEAVYNLDISDNKIIESTNFSITEKDNINTNADLSNMPSSNTLTFDEFFNEVYSLDYYAFHDNVLNRKFYEKKIISDNQIGLNYSYNYKNFSNSFLFNYCYDENSFKWDDKFIIINTENSYNCFYQDVYERFSSLTVKIKTDFKVIDNNADEVDNNVYVWNLDKNNAEEKKIYIKIKYNSDRNLSVIVIIVVLLIIIIGCLLFMLFVKKKNSENNNV